MSDFRHTVILAKRDTAPELFREFDERIETFEEIELPGGVRIVFGHDRLSGYAVKLVVANDNAVLTIFDGGDLSEFKVSGDTLGPFGEDY